MNQKLILFSLCAVLLTGCAKEAPEEKPALRSVEVATVGKDAISSSFSYSGKAAASKEISVVPTVPGKVMGYHFEVGDTVRENQVLFSVDSSTLNDQLRSSEVNYNAAKLSLENTEKTYNNNKILFEQGIIAEAEIDQMKLGYESAKANIEALEVNLDVLKKQISDCTVTSPMSGVIVSRNIERGSYASPTVPAYVIMDLSTIKVEVGVSEQAVNNIKLGDEVQVNMSAASDTPLTGKVSTISPASSQSGTYTVKIELNNKDGVIKSGMLADVSFISKKADNVIVLPISTVITKDGENYIYVVENNVAKKTPVTIGIQTGEAVEITSDLAEGTQVVTRGQTYLSDGEQVEIANPASPATPAEGTKEDTAKEE
ncbi:efflux RND transporter periplasmic adaptor subunit [Anaerotignum sp.]|uniref:efflux RND transporter periplasmic adaptor subunit n=1 Tax=Anaerotignum sp. TaxID=2039241 RepID=UPI002899F749|nr:efflux RND transporter periplasmic adaptor subunit [Anaerotignum sp.]